MPSNRNKHRHVPAAPRPAKPEEKMTQSNSIGPAEPPPPATDLNALSEKITQLERVVRGMGRDSLEASRAQREAQELLQKLQTQLDEMRLESKGILQTVWRTSQESQASMTKAEDHFGAAIRELEARLREEMKWQLQRGLMQAIYPALDDLDLIIANQRELGRHSTQPDSLLDAIILVRSKFNTNLYMLGLEEIKIEVGAAQFDPSQHEAISQEDSPEHASGEIIVPLRGHYTRFQALVGVQWQGGGKGSVVFRVSVDGPRSAQPAAGRAGHIAGDAGPGRLDASRDFREGTGGGHREDPPDAR